MQEFVVLDNGKRSSALSKRFGGRTVEIVTTIGKYPETAKQRDSRERHCLEQALVRPNNKQNVIKRKVNKHVLFLCRDPFHHDRI